MTVTTFQQSYAALRKQIIDFAMPVDTDQWQSQTDVPMTLTRELQFIRFDVDVPEDIVAWQDDCQPNLPWAEDHFEERVSGYAWNPPPSAAYWPFAQKDHEDHTSDDGRFSHTYPERLWPYGDNPAGTPVSWTAIDESGDLTDLVRLLQDHRHTRQAFIPIWWPCDGKMAGALRVPCTIGYHFMIRDDYIHCHYFMRSCDMLRHLRDDIYMAGRLMQWVASQLPHTRCGQLVMSCTSMHVFEGDMQLFRAGLQ